MISCTERISSNKIAPQEEFEFAGNFFLVKITGETGSLERAYRKLSRLGITLPIDKEKLSTRRNRKVNFRITFHSGDTAATERFQDWAIEKIIPKIEEIKRQQSFRTKSVSSEIDKPGTTIELSAVGSRANMPVAKYEARI